MAALVALGVAACKPERVNFSQEPGFAVYFSQHPRSTALPNDAERRLLAAHAPRFMLPPSHPGLIGFYADYIASGTLYDGTGRAVSNAVTRAILNAYKDDPHAVFVHRPRAGPQHPVVLARIDREAGPSGAMWIFLTYNAVFRSSGLPAGMRRWQEWLVRLVADPADWHQLDHYTAATIALDERSWPVALVLQQHNTLRTYLFGRDLAWPADGRVVLDVAVRSNELYPHRPGRVRRRAISMPTAAGMHYLITGTDRPFFAADDITDGVTEAAYDLHDLPHDDAFYSFQGWLGERRMLPGRDGPPGADFNTWPTNKGKLRELVAGYWRETDSASFAAGSDGPATGNLATPAALEHFVRDLRCRDSATAC